MNGIRKSLNPAACAGSLLLAGLPALAQDLADMDPASTEALGQSFDEREEGRLRVLLAGSGASHHFPRDFIGTDAETLTEAGFDVAGTLNGGEAVELLEEADVLVFSGNDAGQWSGESFQEALNDHADEGKGVVILHAASWQHGWDDGAYNERFVAGFSPSHGWGDFEVDVNQPAHSIMSGVPENFTIRDESYRHQFFEDAEATVLATNGKGADEHASVWTVNDPEARIAVITLGHDEHAHGNEAFQSILTNAVTWVGGADDKAAEADGHPVRLWTNQDGREITARLIEARSGEIVIENEDGKRFTIDPNVLSAADQEYLREALDL